MPGIWKSSDFVVHWVPTSPKIRGIPDETGVEQKNIPLSAQWWQITSSECRCINTVTKEEVRSIQSTGLAIGQPVEENDIRKEPC